ncbi:MAG: FAD-binding protein [bacterium]
MEAICKRIKYDGIIVRLAGEFKKIEFDENFVTVGAGISLSKLTDECAKSGLSGLEFVYGIPGPVGGALIMNAGAHGSSIGDIVRQIELVDKHGKSTIISGNEAGFG